MSSEPVTAEPVSREPTGGLLAGPTVRRRWLLFCGLALVIVIADQLSKAWIVANIDRPTPVIGDFVRLTIVHNSGGIFGLFGASAPLLALASTLVIALIVFYQAREGVRYHWLLSGALGLLLGGALGNLIDRLRLGYVIDFVDAGIGATRWYTFNVADSAISVSMVLLIGISLFGDRVLRRRTLPAAPRP
jgi:signal peptidase II